MLRKFKALLVVSAILCVVLSITATALISKTSPSSTTLYVDPPSIEDPTISPGDTITVHIMINSVSNMKTCEFNFTFSPDILSIKSVKMEQVQGQYPSSSMDSNSGYVWLRLSYKNTVTITTDTALVEIAFYVNGYGSTDLHFESSTLLDGAGQPIPHETIDGFVKIFKRNIAVKEISILYSETYVGRIIPINVTVLNDGDIPENFSVSLYYDTTLIGTGNVTNLQPKENTTLTFNWETSTVLPSLEPYTIKAEATILPQETDTLDNILVDGTVKLKIPGDVNGDGTVNIDDLTAWDVAYLSHPGDWNWNEQADINYDNIVDKADATIIIEHYQETV